MIRYAYHVEIAADLGRACRQIPVLHQSWIALVTSVGEGERPAESDDDQGEHAAGSDSGVAPVKAGAMSDGAHGCEKGSSRCGMRWSHPVSGAVGSRVRSHGRSTLRSTVRGYRQC